MELVFDTSVLIDLDNADILDTMVSLNNNLLFPALLEEEVGERRFSILNELNFTIIMLDLHETIELKEIRKTNRRITLCDISAFVIARNRRAILVTGDKKLRELAERNNVEVHGVLWLLDMLVMQEILHPMRVMTALKSIREKGARLPDDDCQQFNRKWSRMIII